MKRRQVSQGLVLIELVVVIGLIGAMLGLAGVALQTVLQASRQHRERETRAAMVMRLDVAFRTDVHQSSHVSLSSVADAETPRECLVLEQPDNRRIEYECREGTVHRTVNCPGEAPHHDAFSLGSRAEIQLAIDNGGTDLQHVSLVLRLNPIPDQQGLAPFQVHPIVAVCSGHRGTPRGDGE